MILDVLAWFVMALVGSFAVAYGVAATISRFKDREPKPWEAEQRMYEEWARRQRKEDDDVAGGY